MIVCGTSDHICWADPMKMSVALIRAGKECEFIPLPGQFHRYDSLHERYFDRQRAEFLASHLQAK